MQELLVAAGVAIVLEGLLYAAFPAQMKRMLVTVLATDEGVLRIAGIAAAAAGLIVVWAVRA